MKWFLFITAVIILALYFLLKDIIRRQALRNMATDVIKAFNKYNVDYWVDFGTLLGIIRESDIIIGDNDVDICIVNYPENIKKVEMSLTEIRNQGYMTEKMNWSAYRAMSGPYFADIYINNLDNSKREFIGATGETSNISYDLIGRRQYIEWNDIKVKVPEKVHDTLVWRYGESYMTPQDSKGRNNVIS